MKSIFCIQNSFKNTFKTTVLFIVFILISALLIVALMGLLNKPQKSDVGVIFGNQVLSNGRPSNRLLARLSKAIELYQSGFIENLIVSGGLGKEGFDEAVVMKDFLVKNGIPSSNIFLDSNGNNTQLTAIHTVHLMTEHNWKSVILVSQYFHLPRAKQFFKNLMLN